MSCYCKERATNPKLAGEMKEIPNGYCGFCEICGKPGHMCAHPRLPTTGVWCDEHWEELVSHRIIPLGDIAQYIFYLLIVGMFIYSVFSAWKDFS